MNNDMLPANPDQATESVSASSGESLKKSIGKKECQSLSDMAAIFSVPAWKQAALLRFMDWLPDKMVTESEYGAALAALDNRRIGGGRN